MRKRPIAASIFSKRVPEEDGTIWLRTLMSLLHKHSCVKAKIDGETSWLFAGVLP